MSYFYYVILKEIKENSPFMYTVGYYFSQSFLLIFSMALTLTGYNEITSESKETNTNVLMCVILFFILIKIISHKKIKYAESLKNIAEIITSKYTKEELFILNKEVQSSLEKSRETFKWVSLIIASVTTLTVSQLTTLYIKLLDFIPLNGNEVSLNFDIVYIINSLFLPLTLIISGYILSFYFISQTSNHNKRVVLLILQNCKYENHSKSRLTINPKKFN